MSRTSIGTPENGRSLKMYGKCVLAWGLCNVIQGPAFVYPQTKAGISVDFPRNLASGGYTRSTGCGSTGVVHSPMPSVLGWGYRRAKWKGPTLYSLKKLDICSRMWYNFYIRWIGKQSSETYRMSYPPYCSGRTDADKPRNTTFGLYGKVSVYLVGLSSIP